MSEKKLTGIEKRMANLKPIKKGEVKNPNGRPRLLRSILKDQGYTMVDIHCTIKGMLYMTRDELEKFFESEQATVLEKMVGSAIISDMEKGQLVNFDSLVSRVWGRPKENVELTGKDGEAIKLDVSDDQALAVMEAGIKSKKHNLEHKD